MQFQKATYTARHGEETDFLFPINPEMTVVRDVLNSALQQLTVLYVVYIYLIMV